MVEWRQSPSFPDYDVSESGDVRRNRKSHKGTKVGKIMKPYVRVDGYRMYILRRDKASFHRKAHQLVAEAFIGSKPFDGAEVCHNDGTRTNDHFGNLRWDTRSNNHADKLRHGTHSRGQKHPMAKLDDEDIRCVRVLRDHGHTQQAIADWFGIKQGTVSRILSGKRWLPSPEITA